LHQHLSFYSTNSKGTFIQYLQDGLTAVRTIIKARYNNTDDDMNTKLGLDNLLAVNEGHIN